MKINPISLIPFSNQLRVKMQDKSMTDGLGVLTPMDKVFRVADLGNNPLFIAEDVFILNSSKKTKEELLKEGIEFEEVSNIIDNRWVNEYKTSKNNRPCR